LGLADITSQNLKQPAVQILLILLENIFKNNFYNAPFKNLPGQKLGFIDECITILF
jgi:hypothetical protein